MKPANAYGIVFLGRDPIDIPAPSRTFPTSSEAVEWWLRDTDKKDVQEEKRKLLLGQTDFRIVRVAIVDPDHVNRDELIHSLEKDINLKADLIDQLQNQIQVQLEETDKLRSEIRDLKIMLEDSSVLG